MKLEPFKKIVSKAVVLPIDDIDTDQIIPARFLKVVHREGLGKSAFADWRYDAQGQPRPDFVLNKPEAQGAEILVAGGNFGCGSSREHAPWALTDYGLKAVVTSSVADIFRNNALKNGLLPVVVPAALHKRLLAGEGNPLTIDLEAQTIALADGTTEAFTVDAFARYRLLNGIDELDFLLQQDAAISAYEREHPCTL